MKAKIFFFKRIFVLITIILSLGSFKTIYGEVNSWVLQLKDGNYQGVVFGDFTIRHSSDTSVGMFVAYNKTSGDSIVGIIGFRTSADVVSEIHEIQMVGNMSIYPNPSTDGNFTATANLKKQSDVTLQIFSLSGQTITNIQLAKQPAGLLSYSFNQSLKAGMYICRLKAGENIVAQKIIVK